ncbi:MAG TPA: TonB-dependent receptor plug domain-containing protein, partial [Anseongella sp.]|nr:TonB-dependent receptor plug domain-containing protein [Anseongella sp.]
MKATTLFWLGILLWGISFQLSAQSRLIEGTVRDKTENLPLPGVNVLEKGTTNGTFTDARGRFELEVAGEGAALIFSLMGYKTQELPAGEAASLQVQLEPDLQNLDEVIVVGYGTQTKRYVTGSVTSVDLGQLESRPATNITQALRGTVAGVQFLDNGRPGQSGTILVRGARSITASNDPLIVLDGAFYNGELADINPNDIASMEVLKDASAAAIYGSRAANGVILITSRKGATGK